MNIHRRLAAAITRKTLIFITAISATVMVWGSIIFPAIASTPTLYGTASYAVVERHQGHVVKLISSNKSPGYGGVDFTLPPNTILSDLRQLSVDYNVTDDDCTAGSPRFQINVDSGNGIKNIYVYIGPQPSYTGCTKNTWTSTGNLLQQSRFMDTSQLTGGRFYDSYETAMAKYGNLPVVGMQLIVDSGYAFVDNEETMYVDNVSINGVLSTFESH